MNTIKVISFERNKQTWFYTGRHRSKSLTEYSRVFTKDVNKIPKSGVFTYCLSKVYPERGLDWRDNSGCSINLVTKLLFEDEYDAEKNVSNIKVVTLKETSRSLQIC